ncbi:MAG: Bax inhibitor-1/YccA family protein [Phycisphaerales bacterium JB058]
MRTANPVFNHSSFGQDSGFGSMLGAVTERPATMSVQGTAWKTLYLLVITAASAAASWGMYKNNPNLILPTMIGSLVGSLAAGIVMLKKPKIAGFVVPVFAFGEGLFVAAFSAAVVYFSPLASKVGSDAAAYAMMGQAAGLTIAIAAAMLFGYASGVLRLNQFMVKMIIVMTVGVGIYYVGAFVINLIFGGVIPQLGWQGGAIGIGFSVFVVALASLNLLLDFQFIDQGVQRGLPKHYEWIGAFGLLTTLVWLYIEMLRLLAKLRSD